MISPYKRIRRATQVIFLATCLIIAWEFFPFAASLEQGLLPSGERPPGVEAFLPISALVSLKYLITKGVLNPVHPSALIILGLVVMVSLGMKKSFCSWVCPVGLLSELLYMLRKKAGEISFVITGIPDILLRSIKYILLFFFVYTILFQMHGPGLEQFIYSAYHIVADIKMLYFFSDLSVRAGLILTGLVILSFIFPYFWCRYLCPYGGLLGLVGFLSPVKIRRREKSCTGCRACDRACPGRISISSAVCVNSDECISCGRCADACPEPRTLSLSFKGRAGIPALGAGAFILFVFLGGSLWARSAGVWQNQVPERVYLASMLETGLLDLDRVEDLDSLISNLDKRGKRLLMMQMMQQREKKE